MSLNITTVKNALNHKVTLPKLPHINWSKVVKIVTGVVIVGIFVSQISILFGLRAIEKNSASSWVVSTIANNMTSLESRVTSLTSKVTALENDSSKFKTLENTVDTNKETIADIKTTLSKFNINSTQITTLNSKINRLTAKVSKLTTHKR